MRNKLCLVASRDGRDEAVTIHQDADVFAASLDAGASVRHELRLGRHAWVQVARGAVTLAATGLIALSAHCCSILN